MKYLFKISALDKNGYEKSFPHHLPDMEIYAKDSASAIAKATKIYNEFGYNIYKTPSVSQITEIS